MHYCILDVLVAITVVVAKSFYSRGVGGGGAWVRVKIFVVHSV